MTDWPEYISFSENRWGIPPMDRDDVVMLDRYPETYRVSDFHSDHSDTYEVELITHRDDRALYHCQDVLLIGYTAVGGRFLDRSPFAADTFHSETQYTIAPPRYGEETETWKVDAYYDGTNIDAINDMVRLPCVNLWWEAVNGVIRFTVGFGDESHYLQWMMERD